MATKRTPNFTFLMNDLEESEKTLTKNVAKLNIELRIFFSFVYVAVKALVYLVRVLEMKL